MFEQRCRSRPRELAGALRVHWIIVADFVRLIELRKTP